MSIDALLNEAYAAIETGRSGDAAQPLKQALQRAPRDHRPWVLLARIAPAQRQAECVQNARKLAPSTAAVRQTAEKYGASAVMGLANEAQPSPPSPPKPAPQPNPTPAAKPQRAQTREPADELAHLRPQTQSDGQPSHGRPWWVWAAAAVGVIGLLTAGGLWLFGGPADEGGQQVARQPTATASPTMTSTPTATASPTGTPFPTGTAVPTRSLIQPKQVAAVSSEPRVQWTATPVPTSTPTPTPTMEPTAVIDNFAGINRPDVGPNERWIDVNLTTQTLTAYEGRTPVLETIISSGRSPYYTVTGQFRIYYRLESQTMDGRRLGFDYVTEGVPHVQYFYGDFALHGAFWHNDFGTPVSHGCVNIKLADAEWLYEWADYGTLVSVHY